MKESIQGQGNKQNVAQHIKWSWISLSQAKAKPKLIRHKQDRYVVSKNIGNGDLMTLIKWFWAVNQFRYREWYNKIRSEVAKWEIENFQISSSPWLNHNFGLLTLRMLCNCEWEFRFREMCSSFRFPDS